MGPAVRYVLVYRAIPATRHQGVIPGWRLEVDIAWVGSRKRTDGLQKHDFIKSKCLVCRFWKAARFVDGSPGHCPPGRPDPLASTPCTLDARGPLLRWRHLGWRKNGRGGS